MHALRCAVVSAAILVATCASPQRSAAMAQQAATGHSCDATLRQRFRPDALTTVVLVKHYRKGDLILLSEPRTAFTPVATGDLCLVKLLVGPGNPGPADAPSTSPGIGIEIWLPPASRWDGRVHALGGGGYVGGPAGQPTAIQDARGAVIAGHEGSVTSVTDAGHPRQGAIPGIPGGGDFGMDPDGTLSKSLWRDFSARSMHEQAVKTKALARFYYGRPPHHAYWEGGSNGGRQGYALAQQYPGDFDGIVANFPAISWSRFATYDLYPQIVFQRNLAGIAPSLAQQDLVSNAAIHACDVAGGQHLGYITDNAACRYDPTQDAGVLCVPDGGSNSSAACVTRVQAGAFNKIWYGLMADGSAPSPATDNGWDRELDGTRLWYGVPRGTSLHNDYFSKFFHVTAGLTSPNGPFTLAADMVALELQNPTIASTNFANASGQGADLWKALSYRQFANAHDRGLALQPVFGYLNADNPDLSAFKARGGRLLTWHGINDEVIPVQGTIRYYEQVVQRLGGLSSVQSFYRLYLVPGNGHAPHNGTSNPDANPPQVENQFYEAIVQWVEQGTAPGRIEIRSPSDRPVRRSAPICPYPQRAAYVSGDPNVAASYACR